MKKAVEFVLNFLLCLGYVLLTRLIIKFSLEGALPNNLLASIYTLYFCVSLPVFIFLVSVINGVFKGIQEIKEVWLFDPKEFEGIAEAYDKCCNNYSGMSKDFNKGYTEAIEDTLKELDIFYKVEEGEEGDSLKIIGPREKSEEIINE